MRNCESPLRPNYGIKFAQKQSITAKKELSTGGIIHDVMTEFAIPKRASVDDLKDILKAYYIEGAHATSVSTDSVEATADMGDKVGRQTNFLVEVGLLSKEGRERKLTQDGEAAAEALMGGNEGMSRSLMRDVLHSWEFTKKINGFVKMQQPDHVQKDRLLEYISANASSTDSRGRKTLVNLLTWTDILSEGEDGYVLSEEHNNGEEIQINRSKSESKQENGDETQSPQRIKKEDAHENTPCHTSFSVNIELSSSDDPSEIKSVIQATRKALLEDLDAEKGND